MCTYTYMAMATKTISITTEAYNGLVSFKSAKDSFSDVINKLTRRYKFEDLIGTLSPKEASDLKKSINDTRKRMSKEINLTALELR